MTQGRVARHSGAPFVVSRTAMTRIINLRQARKARDRDARRAKGDANAALHGEAKPLRDARQAERDRAARVLDAHRRDTPDE